jgi:formamidopyrimidine-DNA glycosylase
MPELPEVEVVRRGLAPVLTGRRITAVTATNERVTRRSSPATLERSLTGRRITAVERTGKYLLIRLVGGDVLVVHLGMAGQLLHVPRPRLTPLALHTHVVLRVAGAGELRYVDPRTFGELFVVAQHEPLLPGLGVDALTATASDLAAVVTGRRGRLKPLLMNQRLVAGLGNIYSDEALFDAGLRWDREGGSLTAADITRLHGAVTTILLAALADGGSSLADGQYVDSTGHRGRYQLRHRVYGRAGQPCVRCRRSIVRARWAGRSTFFCESCQL